MVWVGGSVALADFVNDYGLKIRNLVIVLSYEPM